MRQKTKNAFTIVELIVVIAILSILVGLTVVTYGSWRERTATTELKSDLNNAVLAMNNERNFKNVYPTSLPDSFKSSEDVTVTYKSGDASNFCIQAISKTVSGLAYFVNSTTQKQPAKGTCAGGVGATPLNPGFTAISAGNLHTCGIAFGDNNAYCWGTNNIGQLGNGTAEGNSASPSAVITSGALSGKTIKSIASGLLHTCVVASDNNAYCWGYNNDGQLGNNSTSSSSVPVPVSTSGALSGKTIKSIASGSSHTCAVASDNNAYCWGGNSSGSLGNNSTTNSLAPVPVSTSGALSGKTIKSISANGGGHTCVIASDNNAYCWGINSSGQLGNSSTTYSSIPVAVNTSGVLSGKTIKSISAGYSATCAVASDNNGYCWGYNQFGGLGNNATTNSSVPVAVMNSGVLAGKTLIQISAGVFTTCAVASDSKVYCWGYNGYGGLGDGTTTNSSVPVAVQTSGVLNGKNIIQVNGSYQQCAVASDNNAYCWGYNANGQVGDGTTGTNRLTPVSVLDP